MKKTQKFQVNGGKEAEAKRDVENYGLVASRNGGKRNAEMKIRGEKLDWKVLETRE